jgi:HEAT repeat protein
MASKPLFILLALLIASGCCGSEEVATLTPDLYSSNAKERSTAAWQLARCGSKAEPAVQRLSELLYDENTGVQSAAAYALRKIDTPSARKIMSEIDARRRK